MKLISILFVLALFLVSLTAAAQRKQSVLWQVSGHGLKHPSYLFGTVHTLPPSVLDKFPVKQYMSQAQFGVFEGFGNSINPKQPPKGNVTERPQPPLDSLFTKQDYASVDSFFTASALGSIKEHNRNADLKAMLYAAVRLKQKQADALLSLDGSIAEEMQRMGKPSFALDAEDDPDVNKMLTNYTWLARALVSLVKEKSDGSYFVPDDTDGTYVAHLTINLKLGKKATGLGKDLTVRRNLRWVPQLEQKMQEGSCFIAVGVGHLQFKDGLIKLLRQRGYKLKPVALVKSE